MTKEVARTRLRISRTKFAGVRTNFSKRDGQELEDWLRAEAEIRGSKTNAVAA